MSLVIAVICFALLHQTNALKDAGMAALFLNWLPFIIGIFTIMVYLIVNYFTKKYAWIVTILGGLLNIAIVLSAFFNPE